MFILEKESLKKLCSWETRDTILSEFLSQKSPLSELVVFDSKPGQSHCWAIWDRDRDCFTPRKSLSAFRPFTEGEAKWYLMGDIMQAQSIHSTVGYRDGKFALNNAVIAAREPAFKEWLKSTALKKIDIEPPAERHIPFGVVLDEAMHVLYDLAYLMRFGALPADPRAKPMHERAMKAISHIMSHHDAEDDDKVAWRALVQTAMYSANHYPARPYKSRGWSSKNRVIQRPDSIADFLNNQLSTGLCKDHLVKTES